MSWILTQNFLLVSSRLLAFRLHCLHSFKCLWPQNVSHKIGCLLFLMLEICMKCAQIFIFSTILFQSPMMSKLYLSHPLTIIMNASTTCIHYTTVLHADVSRVYAYKAEFEFCYSSVVEVPVHSSSCCCHHHHFH